MSVHVSIQRVRAGAVTGPAHTARRRHAAILAAILGTLLLVSATALGEDWPQFRGARRDAKSAETGLLRTWPDGGPKLLWTATGLGKGYSQPVVADGQVYVTGMVGKTGKLFAFDLAGKPKWTEPYGKEWTKRYPGVRCTPTVDEGFVYVVSSLGELVCRDARTGQEQWRVNVMKKFKGGTGQFGFIESLLIDGQHVICTAGAADVVMVALDKRTGQTVWKTPGLTDKARTAPRC